MSRYRVVFTTVMGRTWKDTTSEAKARRWYEELRGGMWGDQTVLLREEGSRFVHLAP